jgi:2-polyprenyl-6-methoxyphenol hydroxylase-like FAD-dependent oxidoreductase
MTTPDFDIVIAGAGPAGLLLASQMGSNFRVLVLEKGPIGKTSKFWVSTKHRLEMHSLLDCAIHNATTVSMGTFLGGRAVATGDFVVTNEHKFLLTLAERCRQVGVQILEHTRLIEGRHKGMHVEVQTTSGPLMARLLVDATGGNSFFVARQEKHPPYGYFTVYGSHLTGVQLASNEIVLGYVLNDANPVPVLEIVPTGRDSAFCVLIYVTTQHIEPLLLRARFEECLAQNPFLRVTSKTQMLNIKSGSIPIGKPVSRPARGVFSYGEAGLIQPPFTGAAFNEVLEYNNLVASKLAQSLHSRRVFTEPSVRYPIMKRASDALQTILIQPLISSDAGTFDEIARDLSSLNPDLLFRLLSNELRARDTFSLLRSSHIGGLIRRAVRAAKASRGMQTPEGCDVALDVGYE